MWHGPTRRAGRRRSPIRRIEEPTDAVIEVTSTGLCGSDLHLYEVLAPFMTRRRHPRPRADGHRRGGRLRRARTSPRATASSCRSTSRAGTASCATTGCSRSARRPRSASTGSGAALFGYTKLYGAVPGGQAEYLRVPARRLRADQGARRARPTTGSCTCPTCCRRRGRPSSTPAIPAGGSVAVLGLGPIGDMAARIARHRGAGNGHRHRPRPRAARARRRARRRRARPRR